METSKEQIDALYKRRIALIERARRAVRLAKNEGIPSPVFDHVLLHLNLALVETRVEWACHLAVFKRIGGGR